MTKQQKTIIQKVSQHINKLFSDGEASHDWHHIRRVWKNAQYIGKKENANLYVVELAALLHDIADSKFHRGSFTAGPRRAKALLKKYGIDNDTMKEVLYVVGNISFKKAGTRKNMKTVEGQVVQDADRLDALGAIGIARAFAYGGYRYRPLYNPKTKHDDSTLDHFTHKILHLKKLMNTKTGRQIAVQRDKVVRRYLQQFHKEWSGKDYKK